MNFLARLCRQTLVCVAALSLALPALAQDTVMFNYQGRVKVKGTDFDGPGHFKFAILSPDGSSTLWSNDSTSADGSEPTTGLDIPVTDGVFNVLMGASGQMDSINSTIFQNKSPLKLRTWFSDGVNGFQALHPDHNLVNVNLITSQTGGSDFTIYVNGQTGDDSNSGLKPNQAKKTIQAAVDIVPARVMANVTIEIADGTYAEEIQIFGISCKPGKSLKLVGDESWKTTSTGSPAVKISGLSNTTPAAPVLNSGISLIQCSGIFIEGLEVSGFKDIGIIAEASIATVTGCLLQANKYGLSAQSNCRVLLNSTAVKNNSADGIYITGQSSSVIDKCLASDNGLAGFRANAFSTVQFTGASTSTHNETGLLAQHNSILIFSGTVGVTNNTAFGLDLRMDSYTENFVRGVTLSGNATPTRLLFGSHLYDF